MKISSAKLKQIIKEEIEALGEMDVSSAEDYRQKIEGFAEMVRMVTIGRMPEMLKKSLEDSVKFSVEDVLNHIADDSVRDGVEEMVVDLLGQEYLPGNMNESIGGLMKDLGYEKARKAVASAIDFDEKVENMEDLKALIAKLRSEKDPMGRGRKEELDDIKTALRKMSK